MAAKKTRSKKLALIELTGNKVLVRSQSELDRLFQKGFGERKGRELVLDLNEALFLLERERLKIEKAGKAVSARQLLLLAEKLEPHFYKKFVVYCDFREKGFVIKTGFKFGFDFRVYPRGKKPGEAHSQFVVDVKTQNEKLSMPQLSRMVRLSQNLHTVCLQAVVDSENEINYYSLARLVL
ncbi:MAG: tRNA-intron lyase [Candidatus Diapherotrites archaeon]|uniref:tRNA-intron lyase n=1 Tax=Candidatus Iainarchaeum sp. TaxID=3101447 RepID=A0A8T4L7X2_9ARCH|nr:tRNA-intron lyase [Candidatus Diapherotrites archaeon]